MLWKDVNKEEPKHSGKYLCVVLTPQYGKCQKEIQIVTFNIPNENPNGGGAGRVCRIGEHGYEVVDTSTIWNTSGIVTHWDYLPSLP